ncbi:septum formation protein [Paenibacillus tianmuensis]|uniref:dTTP/UTP pyrophosphatase n=1 Tax=Paenibacillus tianmuensis TaxID=624147 RepID=A0A1G4QP77_9BACL|nr:Maf family protein [Paenibacillus tianmuensis]SCW46245.1 septum formation protein [Paenibacillus tianmuensis]
MKTLVLASSSPRRQELIQMLKLPFEIITNDVDETISTDLPPDRIVEELSLRKAKASTARVTDSQSIVIGSDTIVVYSQQVLGKPKDQEDAFRMLKLIEGKTHQVYTGITCIDVGESRIITRSKVTDVRMKALSDEQIRAYIATGEPMDKAGAYAIQGIGSTIIESINGDHFNVVGMSLSLLSELLEELDVKVL